MIHRAINASFSLFHIEEDSQVPIGEAAANADDAPTTSNAGEAGANATANITIGQALRDEDMEEQEDDPPLFTDLIFHAPTAQMSEEYARKLAREGARVSDELNNDVTHLLFEQKYVHFENEWLRAHATNLQIRFRYGSVSFARLARRTRLDLRSH